MMLVCRAACGLLLLLVLGVTSSANCVQPPPDLESFARSVREALRLEYTLPRRFTYLEQGRDVDISTLGKVSVGPLQTFEVYPRTPGNTWKRLVAVDGKPLDAAELARRDAEHERDLKRETSETANQRAARLKKDAAETRERDAILDDAYAVFELGFICRETFDGQPVVVVALKPRPRARVTTREGSWMKQFAGRMWVSEADHRIARLRLHAIDDVSIGWGVVARIDPGSGFDFVRKRIGDSWLPSELTIEGSGRTLLFRRFQFKTVTTYSRHQPYTRSGS